MDAASPPIPEAIALPLKEAAEALQLSYGALFQAVHRGEIPAFRVGRAWRIYIHDLANLPRWSAILNRAMKDWEWIDTVPSLKRFKEKKGRVRWITPQQAQTLLQELPEHLREAALFSLATGLRQANVFRLEWGWIDLQHRVIRIPGAEFKNGDDHGVALSDAAIGVLKRQLGKHHVRVFTYNGKSIAAPGLAWQKALKRAGIEDFRWHDLRHTSFSWLRQEGVSLDVIEAIGGWRDGKMVRRYAHISAQHLMPHVSVLDNVMAHLRHSDQKEERPAEASL